MEDYLINSVVRTGILREDTGYPGLTSGEPVSFSDIQYRKTTGQVMIHHVDDIALTGWTGKDNLLPLRSLYKRKKGNNWVGVIRRKVSTGKAFLHPKGEPTKNAYLYESEGEAKYTAIIQGLESEVVFFRKNLNKE